MAPSACKGFDGFGWQFDGQRALNPFPIHGRVARLNASIDQLRRAPVNGGLLRHARRNRREARPTYALFENILATLEDGMPRPRLFEAVPACRSRAVSARSIAFKSIRGVAFDREARRPFTKLLMAPTL